MVAGDAACLIILLLLALEKDKLQKDSLAGSSRTKLLGDI